MATSVSQYGITWFFDSDYPVGQFCNGDWYVVAPSGIAIEGISPASLRDPITQRVNNGSMVNPIAGITARQGFDSSANCPWLATLNRARPNGNDINALNPMIVNAGSSIVSSISRPEPGIRPQLSDAAVLTVLDEIPPANSFRPPYCGIDKTILATQGDILWDRVPNLLPTGGEPNLATVTGQIQRPWIEINTEFRGREIHPQNNQPDYGRDMARVLGNAALLACSNVSQAAKTQLVINLIQYGIDVYGAATTGGEWRHNGGHNSGRWMPLMLAGYWLGIPQILDYGDASQYFIFQEQQQTFYVSQQTIDISNGPTWNPDTRATLIPYDESMLGLPEWGIRNWLFPTQNNASWDATYRVNNVSSFVPHALVLQILGLKTLCDWDAFFDYADRAFAIEGLLPSTSNGRVTPYHASQWNNYRLFGGAIWPQEDLPDFNGEPPVITQQPQSQTVFEGQSWSLSVGVGGSPPFSYQWRKNGVNIEFATNPTLGNVSALLSDSGSYDCVVTSLVGVVTSAVATISVSEAPVDPPTPSQFRKRKLPRRFV
jgi:aryl carrier-like protein